MKKAEWIPAHLNTDVSANVTEYFDSRVKEGKNERLIGFFRGRELTGKQIICPEGYEMAMVDFEDDLMEKQFVIDNSRIWELDVPSLDSSLEFLEIAEIGRILSNE